MTFSSIAARMRFCQALSQPAFVSGVPNPLMNRKRCSARIGIGRYRFMGLASIWARAANAAPHAALSRGVPADDVVVASLRARNIQPRSLACASVSRGHPHSMCKALIDFPKLSFLRPSAIVNRSRTSLPQGQCNEAMPAYATRVAKADPSDLEFAVFSGGPHFRPSIPMPNNAACSHARGAAQSQPHLRCSDRPPDEVIERPSSQTCRQERGRARIVAFRSVSDPIRSSSTQDRVGTQRGNSAAGSWPASRRRRGVPAKAQSVPSRVAWPLVLVCPRWIDALSVHRSNTYRLPHANSDRNCRGQRVARRRFDSTEDR
jgi:hypothetical protein